MFMKRRTVTGRIGGKAKGKAEGQAIEVKAVIRSAVITDAYLAKPLPKRLYL